MDDLATGPAGVGNKVTPNAMPPNNPHVYEHANCAAVLCRYPGSGGTPCSQPITCGTVPEHFEHHGVKSLYRGKLVDCQWEGCSETCIRHNFVRHIREKHLGHPRRLAARGSENGRRQHTSLHEASDEGSRSGVSNIRCIYNCNLNFTLCMCLCNLMSMRMPISHYTRASFSNLMESPACRRSPTPLFRRTLRIVTELRRCLASSGLFANGLAVWINMCGGTVLFGISGRNILDTQGDRLAARP
ncbi:hypothetical protein EDC04DRAFT_2711356 [Pisolithus marmoratus]|nr:hypothetical protein EDC04DRAFT_2711356 [Pisolithus marmoratus]